MIDGFARAQTGINAKIISVACGFCAALFSGAVLAAKWLSRTPEISAAAELTSVGSRQRTGHPRAPVAPEAGMAVPVAANDLQREGGGEGREGERRGEEG